MEEKIHLSEIFEFFDENSPESEEVSRILDYSDGQSFCGEVAEKYFNDCVIKLKLNEIDKKINSLTSLLSTVSEVDKRQQLAGQITQLVKQKEKIKNGVQK
jgi:hypothetical protein